MPWTEQELAEMQAFDAELDELEAEGKLRITYDEYVQSDELDSVSGGRKRGSAKGLTPQEYRKKYRMENHGRILAYRRQWYENNKESAREYQRQYRAKSPRGGRRGERAMNPNPRFPVFSERLRELQGDRSNVEFAAFLGMSRQTIGFYLNGDRIPDILALRQIAEHCSVSADWLLGLSDIKAFPGVSYLNKQAEALRSAEFLTDLLKMDMDKLIDTSRKLNREIEILKGVKKHE